MLLLLILALLPSLPSKAFNVDDEFPLKYSQPSAGSYFGYSIAFLSNNHGKWIIVGAPRSNSTITGRETSHEPGQILKCDVKLNSSSEECVPLQFGHAKSDSLKEDRGWLGVSLDISDDATMMVVCGHLVKNVDYEPTGICYAANTSDSNLMTTSKVLNIGVHSYNDDQVGLSAHFLKQTRSVIIATRYGISKTENSAVAATVIRGNNYDFSANALTSGYFYSRERLQIVIGSPKENSIGKVYMYIQELGAQAVTFTAALLGEQIGECFGASLCAVDLDKDGWDELIVGAPMHSKDYDEGKVYVYKISKNKEINLQREITGSEIAARFGSSIAAAGDLDHDGYQDIAIGAPYENGGKGAVYIYHGSPSGINSKYQQKILARGNTRGFGISIAGGMDTDANNYQDIAIGAYGSGEVFIYRTRPTLRMNVSMVPSQYIIDVDETRCKTEICFSLKMCYSTPISTEISRTLTLDTLMLGGVPRVYILVSANSQTQKNSSIISITKNLKFCETINITVPKKPTDYFTPIKMQLTVKLNERTTTTFCPNCPVMHPASITEIEQEVRFKTKCDRCIADLKVKAWTPEFKNTSLIIGSTNQLSMKVKVSNLGDAAYITNLTVHIPDWMTFDTIPTNCYKKSPLYCDVANILEKRQSSTLDFKLNLANIPIVEVGNFTINCTAASQSQEQSANDNSFTLKVPTRSVTDIFVLGSTNEEQILYNRNQVDITEGVAINFSHVFTIENAGPTAMHEPIRFQFLAPEHSGGDAIVQIALNTSVPVSCDAPFLYIGALEINSKIDVTSTSTPSNTSHLSKRDTTHSLAQEVKSVPANVAVLNCSTTACRPVSCTAGPLLKDASITLSFTVMARTAALAEHMRGKDAVVVVTELRVIGNQNGDAAHQSAKVLTEIKPGGVPPTKPVDTWIIAVSVVGGLLLLALVSVILWKVGFFKRPKKDEMKWLTRNMENQDEAEEIS